MIFMASEKTNVMRKLTQLKLPFKEHYYEGVVSGSDVADAMGENHDKVFKTLVTVGKSGQHFVFMIPVDEELDLKKAASAAGEKSVAMIKSKELLPLTGYIHGGCSPIGMKKQFKTFIHQTADSFDTIYFSGGRVGSQVEMAPSDLKKAVPVLPRDLVKEPQQLS